MKKYNKKTQKKNKSNKNEHRKCKVKEEQALKK